ncbi:hypothetical protein OUZ56_010324 [Daphnia magna]|uniref:Uncharacterized protein n=1 Tax=Daphnia magna TaxID=35525 RepID=A0ABR0AI87_9CRUS|nr:hypothetical protein OUZ56_010324 [Daphnia magna]
MLFCAIIGCISKSHIGPGNPQKSSPHLESNIGIQHHIQKCYTYAIDNDDTVPDANTAQNRQEQNKESKKRKGNPNRNKNRGKNNKNNKTISKGGNKTTEKTALTQIAAPRVSSPQPSTSRQAAPTPPVAARTNSNPPARRTLTPHLRENRGNQNSRYTNPPPPTRTTGAPSYPPPATFRWTPTGWERIQRDEPTGRNDHHTGSVSR